MRNAMLAVLASVAVSGCISDPQRESLAYKPHALTEDETARVETDVRRHLENPDALFAGLGAASSSSGSLVVCGWVRRRDYGFPEYARFPENRPFAVRYEQRAGLRGFKMVHFANVKTEAPPLYKYCSDKGIRL